MSQPILSLSQCDNLEQLLSLLHTAQIRTQLLGGIKCSLGGETLPINRVVEKFQELFQQNRTEPNTPRLATELCLRFRSLEESAAESIENKAWLNRCLHLIFRSLDSSLAARNRCLCEIGLETLKMSPSMAQLRAGKRRKQVGFADAIFVRTFAEDSSPDCLHSEPIQQEPLREDSTVFRRRYPPKTLADVLNADRDGYSAPGRRKQCFRDDEILTIHKASAVENLGRVYQMRGGTLVNRPVKSWTSEHNKIVIQQQALKGHSAACATMLILDHYGIPDLAALTKPNQPSLQNEQERIRQAGLIPVVKRANNLSELQTRIQTEGAAIVAIHDPEIGEHTIVLDDLTDSSARLRDPYHAWEITVARQALARRLGETIPFIQAQAPDIDLEFDIDFGED